MTSRARSRGASAVVGLLVFGASALFVASAVGPKPDGASALALVSLAGAAAVLAARGWARRAVGVLLVVAGGAAVAVGLDTSSWWAVVGGLATLVAGAWTVWRGPTWTRLSPRYDRTAGTDGSPHALWDALDRGEDPTQERDDLPQ